MIELRTDYAAHFHGGARARADVRAIVLHSTEGTTARGAAAWFANDASKGSAHVVVDDDAGFRTVGDLTIAYGAHPFNACGLHLEIAGFAAWSRMQWLDHELRLRRGAAVVASWCFDYAIPIVIRTADDVRLYAPAPQGPRESFGIVTHAAIVEGARVGDHTDPGEGFPLDAFLSFVEEQHARDASRREQGP